MTVYSKLAKARVKLQETDIKKSGYNKFNNFHYFELKDFLPSINKINLELGILSIFIMGKEKATLTIVNVEKPEEKIEFELPPILSDVKGANNVQNLGATETYMRRYLFLAAYEITDGEVFDALQSGKRLPKVDDKDSKPKTETPAKKDKDDKLGSVIEEIKGLVKGMKQTDKKTMTAKFKEAGLPVPSPKNLEASDLGTLEKMLEIIKK